MADCELALIEAIRKLMSRQFGDVVTLRFRRIAEHVPKHCVDYILMRHVRELLNPCRVDTDVYKRACVENVLSRLSLSIYDSISSNQKQG